MSDERQLGERLHDQIRDFAPTWTFISEDRSFLCLAIALGTSPSRVVFISHSQATLPFGPESFMADPTKTELLRRTAGIVAVSNYLKDYLWRWGGLDSTVIQFPRYGSGPFPRFGDFRLGLRHHGQSLGNQRHSDLFGAGAAPAPRAVCGGAHMGDNQW